MSKVELLFLDLSFGNSSGDKIRYDTKNDIFIYCALGGSFKNETIMNLSPHIEFSPQKFHFKIALKAKVFAP